LILIFRYFCLFSPLLLRRTFIYSSFSISPAFRLMFFADAFVD